MAKTEPDAPKAGRPTIRTDAVVQEICDRLSQGEPLAKICRDKSMPCHVTVWNWCKAHPEISEAIARAREAGEEIIAADCLEIADDARNDWMEKNGGGKKLNIENIHRSKLRVWTRLQLLARWNPKKWAARASDSDQSGPALNDPNPDA